MRSLKSIKWRLQLWYGLILVLVLAGFGFTEYRLEYGRQMGRVDNELQRRFGMIANILHPRGPERNRPRFGGPPDQTPDDVRPQQNMHDGQFELPPRFEELFDTNRFYFIITRDDKDLARAGDVPSEDILKSTPAPVNRIPEREEIKKDLRATPPPVFQTGQYRNISDALPTGEGIRIGCSIIPELKELHKTALQLFGIGGVILFIGLAGGAWFISRAIRPVEQISSTAVKIAAGDLSQRINVAETESELGKLASVLNSTFARLESAFSQQKQFASDAAHELRTPVTVILTQTQTALNRERDSASYKQTIEACQRAAQRMKKLISALLELTRLDAGQEKMKRAPFDLSKTIGDCIELIHPLAQERHVEIASTLTPVEIAGDAERLAQVVTNLLTNAIQYNHDGGEVRVKLEAQNDFAVLSVSDTGSGIAPEDLSRVFDRFYRADKSRTGANAGLGLAISKAIIDAHGGTIEAASGENGGATFTVRLPKA